MLRLTTWHETITPHQSDTQRALMANRDVRLRTAVFVEQAQERRQHGWPTDIPADIDCTRFTGLSGLFRAVRRIWRDRHETNLFFSPFGYRKTILMLLVCRVLGRRYAIVTEPYVEISAHPLRDDRRLVSRMKRVLRPLAYRIYASIFATNCLAAFGISEQALRQLKSNGYRDDQVFGFGYFVSATNPSPQDAAPPPTAGAGADFRLVYVGSILRVKGIASLIEAASLLRHEHRNVTIDLYGPNYSDWHLDLPGNVRYMGTSPFGATQTLIRSYHALILPSLHDGWGVVINEALLAGRPVLCSDRCGGKTVVQHFGCGSVFRADDPRAIADAVRDLAATYASPARNLAVRRAAEALAPEVAAGYLLACIDHALGQTPHPPVNPWYD